MSAFPAEFIKAIPKTDLHLHLDGSLRIETLIDLARQAGVSLPGQTAQDLRATVFKDRYASLEEYLRIFDLTRILADEGISIDGLIQREAGEGEHQTDVIILTHDTVESRMNAAIARMQTLPSVHAPIVRIRKEELR